MSSSLDSSHHAVAPLNTPIVFVPPYHVVNVALAGIPTGFPGFTPADDDPSEPARVVMPSDAPLDAENDMGADLSCGAAFFIRREDAPLS